MNNTRHPWAVVVFACRESVPQLRKTLEAALISAAYCTVVHVLVNGNPGLAHALVANLTETSNYADSPAARPEIKVWSIPLGDKANAWNQYIHSIWNGEALAFFVDGYVRLNPDAVTLLGEAVVANPVALGGTGVPTIGASAAALRQNLIVNTGYHGNFCCITGGTIAQMRQRSIRLPIGLYRTDSLMGAFLCYALDPATHVWEDARIHVHPQASWQTDPSKWWRARDLLAYWRRHLRQSRGKLENAAIANHLAVRRCSPAVFPGTAAELVLEWAARCPADFKPLVRSSWLTRRAVASFGRSSQMPANNQRALLVWSA